MSITIVSMRCASNHYALEVSNEAEEALQRVTSERLIIPSFKNRSYFFRRNRISRNIIKIFPGFGRNLLPEISGNSVLFLMYVDWNLDGFLSSNRSRKWIYLFDSWEPQWSDLEKRFGAWRNVGCLYLSSSQAVEHFQSRVEFPVKWLPQASTYEYVPLDGIYIEDEQKRIILNIGRPNISLDNFFLNFSKKYDFQYFSQSSMEGILFKNRKEFLSMLNNAAIVVVHPRNIDHSDLTGNVSMVTARYFEAYQSGAVVCGFKPSGIEFKKVFDGYPFLEMHSHDDFERDLLEELEQTEKWRIVAEQAREQHNWDVRAREIIADINSSK